MRRALLAAALCVACGTLTSPGEGDRDLPVGRGGPFRLLGPADLDGRTCVVSDRSSRLDDPSVARAGDGSVRLYFTVDDGAARSISTARLDGPTGPAGEPTASLRATLPWHEGSVEAPEVIRTAAGEWWMLYASAGGIGLARSADGVSFTADPEPLLRADATTGESTPARSPAVVESAPGRFLVAYESAGAVWGAELVAATGAVSRLDGDPGVDGRQPLLAPSDDAVDAGVVGFASGSVGDPSLTLESTAIGRSLWRLYATTRSAPVRSDAGVAPLLTLGVAGSFDGLRFSRDANPTLRARSDGTVTSPDVLADGARRTWLYAGGRCDSAGRVRGIVVAVAPGNASVTP